MGGLQRMTEFPEGVRRQLIAAGEQPHVARIVGAEVGAKVPFGRLAEPAISPTSVSTQPARACST